MERESDSVVSQWINSRNYLETAGIVLTAEEQAWFSADTHSGPPFRVTRYYASLIREADPADPIRLQSIPSILEEQLNPHELEDPLGEADHSPVPRLIRRYPARALFITTGSCAVYCRHCFRRSIAGAAAPPTDAEILAAAEYIGKHPEITELLLSGGDPLMLSDERLEGIIRSFREQRPDLVLRICTRVPVVQPARVTPSVLAILAACRNPALYVVTQFNHPAEVTEESRTAVKALVDCGIPVLNQTVLLRGVNDSADCLQQLFESLVAVRAIPYYLFQLDLAPGTAHFRVSLERTREIYRELQKRLSRLALPDLSVDLPGGEGKVVLADSGIVSRKGSRYLLRNQEGYSCHYTDPGESDRV